MRKFIILCLLLPTALLAQQKDTCQKFKEGFFITEAQPIGEFLIKRRGSQQTLSLKGTDIQCFGTIEWLADCQYRFSFDSCDNGRLYAKEAHKNRKVQVIGRDKDTFLAKSPVFQPLEKEYIKLSVDQFKQKMKEEMPARKYQQIQQMMGVIEAKGDAEPIIAHLRKAKYKALYKNSHPKLKDIQTLGDFRKYMKFAKGVYGPIDSLKMMNTNVQQKGRFGHVASVGYQTFRKKHDGLLSLKLLNDGRDSFQLIGLKMETNDSAQIDSFNRISEGFFKRWRKGNYEQIYRQASDRFKQYTPIADYDDFANRLKVKGKIQSKKLVDHQIQVKNEQIILVLVYELTLQKADSPMQLQLTYAEQDNGQFLLEGTNLRDE